MPVRKKRTTAQREMASGESSASEPLQPEQQEFHQHLRALAQSAVRTVLELVMRGELDAFIGAAWGESSPKRKGYRNGTYSRDPVTATGRIEDIYVPRDREGQFHTQAFERFSRYEPHIARSDLPRCLYPGRVPIRSGKSPKRCWESCPVPARSVASTWMLTQQCDTWRQRPLQEHWRILYAGRWCISAFVMATRLIPPSS